MCEAQRTGKAGSVVATLKTVTLDGFEFGRVTA